MKLITEINEQVNIINEATESGKKDFFIEGPFLQAEKKNRNGRIYPMAVMEREVNRYVAEYVDKNRAYGELGHPSGPTLNLERVSHMTRSLRKEGSDYIGRAKIMDTPYGNIVKNLMSEGATLGVSSRGMGSLKEKNGVMEVQDDFWLATAADIVADPSAPDAFVRGIMEGKEWVWDNGIIKEIDVDTYKKTIQKTPAKNLEQVQMRVFEDFISKL
ncbi:primosomal protein [bacterium]|nr:primosomal protein [bacterium]